uniref:Uncharacterized protein n=1 Tax=Anguilla anguilla TaxID=7936 RepID=A0A0E9XTN6_ANGAN
MSETTVPSEETSGFLLIISFGPLNEVDTLKNW